LHRIVKERWLCCRGDLCLKQFRCLAYRQSGDFLRLSVSAILLFQFALGEPFALAATCNEGLANAKLDREPWYYIAAEKLLDIVEPKVLLSTDMAATNDFFVSKNGEVVVGINGDNGSVTRLNVAGVEYVTGKHLADGKKVFYKKVDSPAQFMQSLLDIHHRAGPIKRLLLFGHGTPGSLDLGEGTMNNFWYLLNASQLKSLPKDLFAPGATVVLVSCELAGGFSIAPNYGINAIRRIFSKLLKQGGEIIASRRIVSFSLESVDDPKAREAEKATQRVHNSLTDKEKKSFFYAAIPILASFAILKGFGLLIRDWKSLYGEGLVLIKVPPT
jgi:hypothetical protein